MSTWDNLLTQLVITAFALATPFVLIGAHALYKKLAIKFKLANADAYEAQLDGWIRTAIIGIEAVSKKFVVENELIKQGEKKLDGAILWVNGELDRHGLDQIDKDALALRIESKLKELKERTGSVSAAPANAPVAVAVAGKV